ncbi:MAG TPA: NfeD family protein, partial [Cytophagaceae bacterium]|nr:NfeD family protein [Cytophagaceae bacterium]
TTVVTGDGEPAPDKYQSYMRGLMRATAEVSGRDPSIAESMVGRPLTQDSSVIGHLISYTTTEAIAHGFCEAQVTSLSEILALNKFTTPILHVYQHGIDDQIVSFFMLPLVKSLLMLLIIGGIYFEFQVPGIGLPSIVAITSALLYFIPSYLSGLSENWEIVLFLVGILLLALELFVIPGFGIAGISGIVLMFASLILVSINNNTFDFTFVAAADLEQLLLMTGVSSCLLFILLFTVGRKLLQNRYFKKITLQEQQFSKDGYSVNSGEHLIGAHGKTFTDLRPSGKIQLNGKIYDAYTSGEFIEENANVEVKEQNMGSLKVRRLAD